MPAVLLSPVFNAWQGFSAGGLPLSGGFLSTYLAGTLTPAATYTTNVGNVANATTIQLDAAGRPPQEIWLVYGQAYKFILTDALGTNPLTFDNISGVASSTADLQFDATEVYPVGTVGRAIHDRGISPCDYPYLCKADDTTDDTAALAQCLAENLHVDLGDSSKKYKIFGNLPQTLAGQSITANRAQIRQTKTNTEILYPGTTVGMSYYGIDFVGVGTDYSNSDSSRSVGIYFTGGGDVDIDYCNFTNFSYTAVRWANTASASIDHYKIVGPGSPTLTPVTDGRCYGILSDVGCTDIYIGSGEISQTAQGLRIEATATFGIDGPNIHDIVGQHGMYLGSGLSNGTVDNYIIDTVSLIGIKLQALNGSSDNISISIGSGTISNTGDQGILICNGSGSAPDTAKCRDITLGGSITLKNIGANGINIQNTVGCSLGGAISIDTTTQSGITFSAASRVTIDGALTIQRTGLSAIRDASPSDQIVVQGSIQIRDCATLATVGDRSGVHMLSCTDWTLRNMIISDANAKMENGVYSAGGNEATLTLEDIQVLNATAYGLRAQGGTALRAYRQNIWAGTTAPTLNEPPPPSVASVAGTITLPQGADTVYLTGTNAVTSINPQGHSGRQIRLITTSTAGLTKGSNLKINSNFTGSADDAIVLTGDGTNFYECSRSVN